MTAFLEEEIIRHARDNPERLPALEMILDRLVLALPATVKQYCTILPEIGLEQRDYIATGEAIDSLPETCLVAVATSAPWSGRLACAIEPDLLFSILEVMLGGARRAPSEWTPRAFTAIERGIGQRIAELALGVLQGCFSPVAETVLSIEAMETTPKAVVLAPSGTPSILARFSMDLDGRKGHMSLILPYGGFGAMRGLLSKSFHGGQISNSGWAGEMGQQLTRAEAKVTAVLTRIRMPLSQMLELKRGDVVELGVPADHEVSGYVNGTPALRGAFGYPASGSLAIRVSERLVEKEEALKHVRDPD